MTDLTRRCFMAAALAAVGTASLTRTAQATTDTRPRRIFMVLPRSDMADAVGFQAYLAGSGIPIEYIRRVVGSDPAKIQAALEEIRHTRPDLVFSVFTQITQDLAGDARSEETALGDIPLVFSSVTDPVAANVVSRLREHGRNITGTRHIAPIATQLKVIASYRPFQRLAIIYNALEPNMLATVAELRQLSAINGFTLIEKAVPVEHGDANTAAMSRLVAEAAGEGAEFLYIGPDSLIASKNSEVIAEAALACRLPTFCATELPIRTSNVLFGLVSRAYNVGSLAGFQATQILAHGKPAREIPIETLQRFALMLRMSVAKELHFFPPMLLLKIAEVNTDSLAAGRKTRPSLG